MPTAVKSDTAFVPLGGERQLNICLAVIYATVNYAVHGWLTQLSNHSSDPIQKPPPLLFNLRAEKDLAACCRHACCCPWQARKLNKELRPMRNFSPIMLLYGALSLFGTNFPFSTRC